MGLRRRPPEPERRRARRGAPPRLRPEQDAFGRWLLDCLGGRHAAHVIERDDGFIDAGGRPSPRLAYFGGVRRWPAVERRALRFVRGRVLDVGCGAGRVALELQRRGHDVLAIDVSPLAVKVARRRGVSRARVLALERVGAEVGRFDTVLMYGNNLGLLGGETKARRLLRRLHGLTSARGRIVAASNDPYRTDDPNHLAYQERNRRRGRMPGLLRLRVRYRNLATPWFDYLIISPGKLESLLAGTGWRLAHVVRDEGSHYVAVLEKVR